MNVYEKRSKKIKRRLRVLLPLLLLVFIFSLFVSSISRISTETLLREKNTLEQALRHGVVQTYAISGQYPESLDELLSEYRITYDSEHFIVDYTPNGANLFPMISVLPRSVSKGGQT